MLNKIRQKEELTHRKNNDSKSINQKPGILSSITYIFIMMIIILIVAIYKTINSIQLSNSNGHEVENYEKNEAKSHKQGKSKDQKMVSTLTQTLTNWFNKCICIID